MTTDNITTTTIEETATSVPKPTKKESSRYRKEPAPLQGQEVMFPEPKPWHEPVEAKALLDELTTTFKRFAVLPKHADTALALWVTFTWCIASLKVAPILAICSPEKQCGKTTVLSLVGNLSARALPTSNLTTAALFRVIEAWQPTLLIDEADTFIRESDEMRGVLNSGHTRNMAHVIRVTGDSNEPRRFSTWAAKSIALIGKLPETLHDRSIVIELRRKLAGETTEKLRNVDSTLFETLHSKLRRFADDNAEMLKAARPVLPDTISDRAADNWEPLIAIAALAGKDWEDKALQAAQELSSHAQQAASIGTELLADIETVFYEEGEEKISSKDLIMALCANEERPWATYNRGFPITPRQVARILAEYGIHSKGLRIGGTTPKGYELSQFDDALLRYVYGGCIARYRNNATCEQNQCS